MDSIPAASTILNFAPLGIMTGMFHLGYTKVKFGLHWQ